jgi:Domain of unknown function (DUF4386)
VPQEHLVGRDPPPAHGRLPVLTRSREGDLADGELDDAVQDRVLVGHVLVQRHRLDAELLAEPAHGQRFDAAGIGERERALLALLWRMAEAIVGAVTVLLGVLVVLLVGSEGVRAAFEPAQLRSLVDVLLTARTIGYDVTILFLSLGTIVHCGLLYRSRYVPRVLAGLGIVFEVVIGVWLLLKGVSTTPATVAAPQGRDRERDPLQAVQPAGTAPRPGRLAA